MIIPKFFLVPFIHYENNFKLYEEVAWFKYQYFEIEEQIATKILNINQNQVNKIQI